MNEEVQVVEPSPVTIVETPQPSIEDTMAEVYDKNYPDSRVTRAADTGQFKSKDAAEAAPTEGAETGDTETETPQEPTTETVEPETKSPAIDMPASWASDRAEIWAKLSPEAQQFVAERESQAQSKISELGRAAKATESLKPALEPLERIAAQKGIAPAEVIQRFLAADEFLAREPLAAIQWLANAYRIDLSQFGQQPTTGDNPESAHISALTQKISQLERQISETSNQVTARERAETQAREQTLAKTVEDFAKGKDHWPEIEKEVYHQILALKSANPERVQSDPLSVLKEAEDRAIKLMPEVQAKLTEAKRKAEEATKKAESVRKATEAKKLASLNVKSSAGASPKPSAKNMTDEMAEIYDRLQATG